MHTLTIAWEAALHLARLVFESARYALTFMVALPGPRAKLAAEIVALRSQLAACRDRVERKQVPKPRFSPAFRVLWVVLSRFPNGWEDLAQLMKPATVKRRKPREPSTTWLPFLRNHLDVTWAIDFSTVTTISFATI